MSSVAEPRTIPHDLEAEKCVLGAVLIDNTRLPAAAAALTSGDFFREAHRQVFGGMLALAERSEPIDPLTLKIELGDLDVGGAAYVASLTDGVPHAANVEHYARIVKAAAVARRLIQASTEARARAYDGDVAGSIAALDRVLQEPAIAGCVASVSNPLIDDVTLIHRPAPPQLIDGRLPSVGLAVLVAPPDTYKTFTALSLAAAVTTKQATWLGAAVSRSGPVVYVIGEGAHGLGRRIAGLKIALGISLDDPMGLHIWDGAIDLRDGQAVRAFIATVRPIAPIKIVWDTFARCTPGADEVSGRDVGAAIAGLDRVSSTLGCLNLVLHHTNASESRERGHSSLRGARIRCSC